MNNAVSIKIIYDSESLQSGLIPIRDLAPSLLSLADAMEEAYNQVIKDNTKLKIYVKSDFEKGSFHVNLFLEPSVIEYLINFFTSPSINAIATFLALFGSAINLVKFIKNRKIASEIKKGKDVILELEDKTTITTNEDSLLLYKNISIRKKLKETLSPLENSDINLFKIIDGNNDEIVTILKDEVNYFETEDAEIDKIINEYETTKVFKIVNVAFKDGNKWRLEDGSSSIYATLLDPIYLDKIEKGIIAFKKHDLIKCKIKTTQKVNTKNHLKTEHEIIEVMNHWHQEKGQEIPFHD